MDLIHPPTSPWKGEKVVEWAMAWLTKYQACTDAGEHVRGCKCKTGPPLGLLTALVLKQT